MHHPGASGTSTLFAELQHEIGAVLDASERVGNGHLTPRHQSERSPHHLDEPGFGVALGRRLRRTGGEDSPKCLSTPRADTLRTKVGDGHKPPMQRTFQRKFDALTGQYAVVPGCLFEEVAVVAEMPQDH